MWKVQFRWCFVMINRDMSWLIMINLQILWWKITNNHKMSPKITKCHEKSSCYNYMYEIFLVIFDDFFFVVLTICQKWLFKKRLISFWWHLCKITKIMKLDHKRSRKMFHSIRWLYDFQIPVERGLQKISSHRLMERLKILLTWVSVCNEKFFVRTCQFRCKILFYHFYRHFSMDSFL